MEGLLARCGAFIRTVRYLKPQQIVARVDYRVRSFYYRSPFYHLLTPAPQLLPEKLMCQPPLLWPANKASGQALLEKSFTFVGRTVHMGPHMQWQPGEVSDLWLYHLHYFEWLTGLKTQGNKGRLLAQELTAEWLAQYEKFHPKIWHPYPLSLRVISWINHAEWLLDGADEAFSEAFWDSLLRQVNHLEKVLEWDVGGNHLLKNVKALIYAGLCLPERQSTYLDGLRIFLDQIALQILPDGGHYERSPHYHVDVLRDLLDVRALLRKAAQPVPVQLNEAIDRMTAALQFYIYPDGRLGLFNDGEIGDAAELNAVLKQCSLNEDVPASLPDTGYARLQSGNLMLMLDGGVCCPDELPAHAHADTLSFELCWGNQRVFVNNGTYAYQHPRRNVFRGTAAHNTVVIDKQNSAEVWGAFRLGRRPTQVTLDVRREKGIGFGVTARHNGYRHLGVEHERRIFLAEKGHELRGEDIISGGKKRIVEAHFHLHPDVRITLHDYTTVQLELPDKTRLQFKIKGGKFRERESMYAPYFGESVPSRQLLVRGDWVSGKGCTLNWALKLLK